HRVEVGRDDLRLRYRLIHCAGDDAGADGGFEDAGRLEERHALGDELRIGLEQQRAHVAVVKRRSRMLEGCAFLSHRNGLFPLRALIPEVGTMAVTMNVSSPFKPISSRRVVVAVISPL